MLHAVQVDVSLEKCSSHTTAPHISHLLNPGRPHLEHTPTIIFFTATFFYSLAYNLFDTMRPYPIKRGHFSEIEGDKLQKLMKNIFGNAKAEGDKLVSNYGAIDKVEVWLEGKKIINISTKMKTDVDNDTASDTIKVFNNFLFESTGFTTKERKKRANK
jgi:hypothetical protein